jgi:hypothetical protein
VKSSGYVTGHIQQSREKEEENKMVQFVDMLTMPYNIENLRAMHAKLQACLTADPNNEEVLRLRNQVTVDMERYENLEAKASDDPDKPGAGVRALYVQNLGDWAMNAQNNPGGVKLKPMPTLVDTWNQRFKPERIDYVLPPEVKAESEALAVVNSSIAKAAGLPVA